MHVISKRRTWRKLHVGANPEGGEIQAVLLTENNISDDQVVEKMLEQIEQTILDFRQTEPTINAKYMTVSTHIPLR